MELVQEKSKEAALDKGTNGTERWEHWVPDFIKARHCGPERANTLQRVQGAWKQWYVFLMDNHLCTPRSLTYNDVLKFVTWRSSQVRKTSKKQISKNTALADVKFLSGIMTEAIHRGLANVNPCQKLGIPKDESKEKPEITDHELVKIREALKSRPEWMSICFEISWNQGCRLRETQVPMYNVDLVGNTISFQAKRRGGRPHYFTTSLVPTLRPLMERLRDEGHTVTCVVPDEAGRMWHEFFKEIGLGHLCFHCCRVSVVTRLARAGISIQKAMRFVGHASELIHRIYLRLRAEDVADAAVALASSNDGSPQSRRGRQATPEVLAA